MGLSERLSDAITVKVDYHALGIAYYKAVYSMTGRHLQGDKWLPGTAAKKAGRLLSRDRMFASLIVTWLCR